MTAPRKRRSLIPAKRTRLGQLIGLCNKGLLTVVEEQELRELVAREGYPVAREEDLGRVVDRGYGIILADLLVGEA